MNLFKWSYTIIIIIISDTLYYTNYTNIIKNKELQMRYEPYRMAKIEELPEIAHRRAIAAVDWVVSLAEIADITDTEDKVIKNA